MAGAGMLVYTLESSRIERLVTSQIIQETEEFRRLRRDPNTGEPFDDVESVLDVFLTRNVPDDDEMLVGYVDGVRTLRTANRYGEEFLDDPAYLRALEDRADDGGTAVIESADVRRGLGDRGAGPQRAGRGIPRHHQLPRRRARRARRHAAHLHGRRVPLAAAHHRHRRPPVRPPARPAAHPRGDRARHLDHRPVAPDPRARQRRHHVAHPHDQLDARAPRRRVPRPAPVPRRRGPRAAYAAHGPARTPRAPRRRRPGRARGDPGAAARRGGPDVPARRRPDPAGQEPAPRLPRRRRRPTSRR